MAVYEELAKKATQLINDTPTLEEAQKAWQNASYEIYKKPHYSQKKSCPKNAFLGYYGLNLSSVNAQYAKDAREYLEQNNIKSITSTELWGKIMKDKSKTHNQQMHVVIALHSKD